MHAAATLLPHKITAARSHSDAPDDPQCVEAMPKVTPSQVMPLADMDAATASIPAIVAGHAIRTPGKPAFIVERDGFVTSTLGYAALMDWAAAFRDEFRARGLADGAVVVIMLVSHPALPAALLGAMMAGLVPSLFPPATQKMDRAVFWAAQQAVFEHIGVSLIVTVADDAAELAQFVPSLSGSVVLVDDVPPSSAGPSSATRAHAEGVACLQHSSGTTGAKKGVILTHGMLIESVHSLASALAITDADIVVSWLPLYHDMGLINCLFVPMLLGLTAVQLDPFEWVSNPPLLLAAVERHRATLCWMPNFAFHHLIRTTPASKQFDLSSMRVVIDAAEPCKPETLTLFARRFADHGLNPLALQVGYGMAENVCIATQTDLDAAPRTVTASMSAFALDRVIRPPTDAGEAEVQFLSCGRAIPGTRLRIVDEAFATLPDDHVGQIAVASPYLFSGYYKRALKPGTLVDGWYMSGDLGFMRNGELYVSGRADDLLIVNGRNLYAHDIEFAINAGTQVKPGRCVAIGPFSRRLGSQALVVIAETPVEDEVERRALATAIRTLIHATFGVTTHDVLVKSPGWLVKTTSGKISREANLRLYQEERPVA